MLKKKNRLTKKEFELVFKKGKKNFSKNFMFLKIDEKENWKISTSVSKKIYKNAVQRNQARRKIYDILGKKIKKIPKNFWSVLIITKPILKVDKNILEKEIMWLIKKK